jgi:hypothetical protein
MVSPVPELGSTAEKSYGRGWMEVRGLSCGCVVG